ncbi:MAG: cupredoxin domain-containing protein [Actinomycetota bacterium]
MRTAVLIGAVLALAACGGSEDTGGGGGGGGTSLSMVDNAFEPVDLTVSAGTSLDVSNDGENLHNITIEGTDIDQDVEAGQSAGVAIDAEAGEYTMFCEYHRGAGMEGTITVQ